MLAAPFLLLFEALPRSQRYAELAAAPLSATLQPYSDLRSAMVLFQAHYFGRAPQEEPWSIVQAELVGGFSGVLGIAAFFGLLAYVVRRRAWRSTETFFLAATVLVFGVIDAWPLLDDAIHAVLPVVAHARFRMLFVLLMDIQAAATIDLTQRGDERRFSPAVRRRGDVRRAFQFRDAAEQHYWEVATSRPAQHRGGRARVVVCVRAAQTASARAARRGHR
jgi:hypothetical protein